MINWECKNCRKETDHQTKETELTGYSDYKILICQECGEKEMVPKRVLDNTDGVAFTISESVGNDGGFDRDVGSDCDSGICPVRQMKKLKAGEIFKDEELEAEAKVLAVAHDDFYKETVYFIKYKNGLVSNLPHWEIEKYQKERGENEIQNNYIFSSVDYAGDWKF